MKLQVGVKVLLTDIDGSVLLLQRSEALLDGSGIVWDIPGGRINPEESIIDALKREVKEEVDLELDKSPLQLLGVQDIFVHNEDIHIIRLTYTASITGDVTLSEEHSNYAWVPKDKVFKYDVDKYLKELLKSIQN